MSEPDRSPSEDTLAAILNDPKAAERRRQQQQDEVLHEERRQLQRAVDALEDAWHRRYPEMYSSKLGRNFTHDEHWSAWAAALKGWGDAVRNCGPAALDALNSWRQPKDVTPDSEEERAARFTHHVAVRVAEPTCPVAVIENILRRTCTPENAELLSHLYLPNGWLCRIHDDILQAVASQPRKTPAPQNAPPVDGTARDAEPRADQGKPPSGTWEPGSWENSGRAIADGAQINYLHVAYWFRELTGAELQGLDDPHLNEQIAVRAGLSPRQVDAMTLPEIAVVLRLLAREVELPDFTGLDERQVAEVLRTCWDGFVTNAAPGKERAPVGTVTRIDVPVADVGPLPPDLLAAFNGAAELATSACYAAQLIASGGPRAFYAARSLLVVLVREHNPARDAILKVANDLANTRQYRGPARFGKIVRATAHEAALALSVDIDQRIRSAVIAAHDAIEQAEPGTWVQFVVSHEAAPNLDWLHRHFRAWCQHFDGAGLPSSDEVIAELGLEARGAAQARTLAPASADRRQEAALPVPSPPVQAPPVSRIAGLLEVATREYAASKGSFWLAALPPGLAGARVERCDEHDPACGAVREGCMMLPVGSLRALGSVNLGEHGVRQVLAFSLVYRQPDELSRFTAFAAEAGASLVASPPAWARLADGSDPTSTWVAALMFLAPSTAGHVETSGGGRLITQPWAASVAALRDWERTPQDGATPDQRHQDALPAGQIPPARESSPTPPRADPPSLYDYVSTEDAIRAARQGALDTLRRLKDLRSAICRESPPGWYAEAARWLVESWARRRTRWPAAVQTTALAGHLPAAAALAPAVRAVEHLIPEMDLACINALPYVQGVAGALARVLFDAPPENLEAFYIDDWPRLLSLDHRWAVTREDRITPTLRRLRTDSEFRRTRKGMDRAICKWEAAYGQAETVTRAQYRRATTGFYRDEPNIELEELHSVLAAHDPDVLRATLTAVADGAALARIMYRATLPVHNIS
jgi:hypothetical protein